MALSSRSARRFALVVALGAFALVAALGALTSHAKPLGVPAAQAAAEGAQAPEVAKVIRPGDRPRAIYVDERLVKVTWYRGDRAVAVAGVQAGTGVIYQGPQGQVMGWGARLSHDLTLLVALTVLFLLVTLRVPLHRDKLRTLDLLMVAGLVVSAVLFDKGYFAHGEAIVALQLLYLIARGATFAVRGPRAAEDPDAPVLLEALAARIGAAHMTRQLGWALLAATVLVTLTSNGIIDIAIADMEGATVLLHGHLPYGNMPGDIVHGDTYGLPAYAFYAPFAAIWPMADDWGNAFGSLVASALLTLGCVWTLARTLDHGRRWPTIVAFLAFPVTLMSISSGTNDLLIFALLLWAFMWWTRPVASTSMVMLAGAAKLAPLVLLPLWLARLRGRDLVLALAACAGIGAAVLAGLLALGGLHGPLDMADAIAFQFSRVSELSVWTQLPWARSLQPLAQGLTMAAALGGATLVLLDRDLAADPRRVAGLVTAVLAGLQLSANHWAPMYLLWLAPPVMLALVGPLGGRVPATARDAETVRAGAEFAPA